MDGHSIHNPMFKIRKIAITQEQGQYYAKLWSGLN